MKKQLTFLAALLLITVYTADAQQNHSMYFSYHLPQSNYLNPAYQSTCKWWIGVPVLSSAHINYANSFTSFNKFFKPNNNGIGTPQINQLVDGLNRNNFIGLEFHTTLLGLGYHWNNWYFNFNITEKIETDVFISRNLLELMWRGNAQYIGETVKIKNTGLLFNHYREYALGASKNIAPGLMAGAKAKLLFGKLNASTSKTYAEISTSQHEYYLNFMYDIEVNTSLPIGVEANDDGHITSISANDVNLLNLLLNRKNWGLAFDVGTVYRYNNKVTLSASLLDMGSIRWRSNLNTLAGNGGMQFNGITTSSEFNITTDDFIVDTISFTVENKKYWKMLPAKLLVGGQYHLNRYFNANLLLTTKYYPEKWVNTATVAVDIKPVPWFYLTTSYTAQYSSFNNVGLGFTLGHYPVQFYAYTDNLVGIIKPLSAQNLNLRFGFNMHFGCRENIKTQDNFSIGQVPCPDIKQRKNPTKEKVERRKMRK